MNHCHSNEREADAYKIRPARCLLENMQFASIVMWLV